MRPRTRELLEQADEWLDDARLMVSAGGAASAISPAYYAMHAPRARPCRARSQPRRHVETWDLFGRTFVDEGAFDGALADDAERTRLAREDVDVRGPRFSVVQGERDGRSCRGASRGR